VLAAGAIRPLHPPKATGFAGEIKCAKQNLPQMRLASAAQRQRSNGGLCPSLRATQYIVPAPNTVLKSFRAPLKNHVFS